MCNEARKILQRWKHKKSKLKKKKKSLFVLYLQVQLQKRLMDRQTTVRIKKLGVLHNLCSQIMYFLPQLKGNSNKRKNNTS